MSDAFHDREKSFEAKYKLDSEFKFKAHSRRNKLIGLWAAERMGMTSAEAAAYAKAVVIVDLEEPGDDDVVRKLVTDMTARGAPVSETVVRDELDRQMAIAVEQVSQEYPKALGPDHEPVGG
ncbi:MAG: DUF1476 domain-containing protein [Rhodobacterales bacterium]|nr:DUF1476 domain-containing protein [Rhodobacterales bacterium]